MSEGSDSVESTVNLKALEEEEEPIFEFTSGI